MFGFSERAKLFWYNLRFVSRSKTFETMRACVCACKCGFVRACACVCMCVCVCVWEREGVTTVFLCVPDIKPTLSLVYQGVLFGRTWFWGQLPDLNELQHFVQHFCVAIQNCYNNPEGLIWVTFLTKFTSSNILTFYKTQSQNCCKSISNIGLPFTIKQSI